MRLVLDDHVTIAALRGHFHRARGLRRRLVLINLNPIPLKCSEKVVDLFGGMHFRRKRIVHFVVKQVSSLFAYCNELLYSIIFFFKPYCCHEFLPPTTRNLNCGRLSPPKSFSSKGTGSMP